MWNNIGKWQVKRWFSRSQVDGRRLALTLHAVRNNPSRRGVTFSRATKLGISEGYEKYTVCDAWHTCVYYGDDFTLALQAFIREEHRLKVLGQ
jgi:hypothetical protein